MKKLHLSVKKSTLSFKYISMKYSRSDLINALCSEWDYLCHDDFDPENDPTTEEYREEIQDYTYEQLVEETGTDEGYTLKQFMENWL